jgi:SAM-dependent methyltransferase
LRLDDSAIPGNELMTDTDGGWAASARAYISFQDAGDRARTHLLDPVMLRLCGDVAGARTIDVGCGEGRFSRMLIDRGALAAGIDLTAEMVQAARERGSGEMMRANAERLPFGDASFDVAVSYITLVDIPDYRRAIAEMSRVLSPGGRLVVANIGFVSASQAETGGWLRDDAGNALYVPIDNYTSESSRVYEWEGIRIENWHRPLSAYMSAYLEAGLILRDFLEPVPADATFRDHPDIGRAFRVPWFTVMRWEKPAAG